MDSLIEGDEQLDWHNSQTTMELCHAFVALFFVFNMNTTAFCLGWCSLHLLLLKSSMLSLSLPTPLSLSLLFFFLISSFFMLHFIFLSLLPLLAVSDSFKPYLFFSRIISLFCSHSIPLYWCVSSFRLSFDPLFLHISFSLSNPFSSYFDFETTWQSFHSGHTPGVDFNVTLSTRLLDSRRFCEKSFPECERGKLWKMEKLKELTNR